MNKKQKDFKMIDSVKHGKVFVIFNLNGFTHIINKYRKMQSIKSRDNYKQFVPSRIFYRGEHSLYKSPNVAGVYRGNYQASALYHAYMRRFYDKFENMHNFSKLTYMQHFGLSTCLLDITANPLVALFFACLKTNNKQTKPIEIDDQSNGVVHIVLPKNGKNYKIYNSYSDTMNYSQPLLY